MQETEEIFEALSVTMRQGFFLEGRKLRGIGLVKSISNLKRRVQNEYPLN